MRTKLHALERVLESSFQRAKDRQKRSSGGEDTCIRSPSTRRKTGGWRTARQPIAALGVTPKPTQPLPPSRLHSATQLRPSHVLQKRPRVDPERHQALHCQGMLPPSHHGRTNRPAIHDGRRRAAVGRDAESSSALVVQMDSHKCDCRWNNGSCGPNQTFCSQIPAATRCHHVQASGAKDAPSLHPPWCTK